METAKQTARKLGRRFQVAEALRLVWDIWWLIHREVCQASPVSVKQR